MSEEVSNCYETYIEDAYIIFICNQRMTTLINIINMRVSHLQYGEGSVVSESNGMSKVNFDHHGILDVKSSSLTKMNFIFS